METKKKKDCGCNKKSNKRDIKMSVPEGKEFGKNYTMDHTIYNEHYWDVNRNRGNDFDVDVSEGEAYVLPFDIQLDKEIKKITDLLKQKNRSYGNSALNPANIFSKLGATESLLARIDDKIMRIKNKGINDKTEDTVDDLIGYLLLLKMSM